MYKLYYAPGTCSMAVHVALLECNQELSMERVDFSQPRSPEYLKLNPRGSVPVLVDDGQVIREGAAILIHILEKCKSPLLPASGKERAIALEWLMFANATMHPAYARCFFLKRNGEDGAVKDKMMDNAAAAINKLWDEVEQRLSQNAYICGSECSIADILLTVIATWSGNIPRPINFGPNTKKLFRTVISRPAYMKALDAEKVEYKVAA